MAGSTDEGIHVVTTEPAKRRTDAVAGSGHRREDIQGLRAIAVLTVVFFHAGLPVPGGFIGVDVFFVISGFVITAMLHREATATGRIRFGNFYLRRFKRLTPALALMVAVTMVMSALILSPLGPQETTAKTALGAMLLVANVVIARTTGGYFDAPAESNALLNTWSLSVEEQFYLLFPLILFVGWRLGQRRGMRHLPLILVGLVAVVSFALVLVRTTDITFPGASLLLGFYSPVVRAWEFAAGALLALLLSRLTLRSMGAATVCGAGGLLVLGVSLWAITSTTTLPGPWMLLPVLGSLLLLLAGATPGNLVSRLLGSKPMEKVGDWSYSIYLWHWPFIVFAAALWPDNEGAAIGAAVLSLVPALASYWWVEGPIRAMRPTGRGLVLVVATTLAIPVVVAGAVGVAAQKVYWIPDHNQIYEAVRVGHAGTDCAIEALNAKSCTWNPTATGTPLYLVGDSTAGHFAEAAIEASRLLDRPLKAAILTGCPFKDVYIERLATPGYTQSCRDGYDATMAWLEDQPPGVVVVSELNSWYRQDETAFGRSPNMVTKNPEKREQVLGDAMVSTIVALQNVGHSVLMVQAAPAYEGAHEFSPQSCTVFDLAAKDCHASMPLVDADEIQQVERRSLEQIAEATGVALWDPRDFFCADGTCVTEKDGASVYRDEFHISVQASVMLGPDLAQAVDAVSH